MRTVTLRMTNMTTEQDPSTMTITNASATLGEVNTTGFPISVGTNGDNKTVDYSATDERQGSVGSATYVVQNIKNSSVDFSNTMSQRNATFRIGNDGKKYELNDNGTKTVKSQGYYWTFRTSSNGDSFVINVEIGNDK